MLQEHEFERVGGNKTIKVDVRVIAATNRDLAREVANGNFRADLYYRLGVFPIHVPPLREHPEDIGLLVPYFVRRYASKIGRKITHVSAKTEALLGAYSWPGNVRELENVIERAVILSPGPELDIPPEILTPLAIPAPPTNSNSGRTWTQTAPASGEAEPGPEMLSLSEIERTHILAVLKQTNWRIDGPTGAARALNMNPSTLRSRMKKLAIRRGSSAI